MQKLFWQFVLRLFGWKIKGSFPKGLKKGIIVVAPHTSNWDFPLGLATRAIQKFPSYFLIKDDWLKIPVAGKIIKAMGGVGVDRSKTKKLSTSEQIIKHFKTKDEFVIAIAPEGTRKYNPNWKTGFWHIAKEANIPLIPASFDYATKQIIWFDPIQLSEDKEADIERLKDLFRNSKGKFPEQGVL